MTLSMFFNEQSLRKPAKDAKTAREWMNVFVKMLLSASSPDYGLNVLRTHTEFKDMSLAPDYPMSKWFNDGEVSKDMQDFVLTYATRHQVIKPYIFDLSDDDEIRKRNENFIGSFDGDIALGLGFAYLLSGLSISLVSESCWDVENISLNRLEEVQDSENLIDDIVNVPHVGRDTHLALHHKWIIERNKNSVIDGKDLLRKAKKWYPHLVFSDNANKQLSDLGRADIHLPRIVERLFDLERSWKDWEGSGYDIEKLLQGASHESKETLNEFGKTRMFKDPKEIFRNCEMHMKNIPEHWRIHFWPDNDNEMGFADGRRFLIGYIGKHRETKSGF